MKTMFDLMEDDKDFMINHPVLLIVLSWLFLLHILYQLNYYYFYFVNGIWIDRFYDQIYDVLLVIAIWNLVQGVLVDLVVVDLGVSGPSFDYEQIQTFWVDPFVNDEVELLSPMDN